MIVQCSGLKGWFQISPLVLLLAVYVAYLLRIKMNKFTSLQVSTNISNVEILVNECIYMFN